MDISDFEELIADMLGITDEQRNKDPGHLPDKFFEKFNLDFEGAYELTKHLLLHTVPIQGGLSSKYYYAFVSKNRPCMLMKFSGPADNVLSLK